MRYIVVFSGDEGYNYFYCFDFGERFFSYDFSIVVLEEANEFISDVGVKFRWVENVW